MTDQDVAIISDIHGNSFALREVLKDIKARGISTIINLGDSLYGPLDPRGTFEQLCNQNIISISGNQDRFILENLNKETDIPTLEYVKSQLDDNSIEWLNSLQFDLTYYNKIYGCHGTPESDTAYLLEKLNQDFISIKNNEELDRLLKPIKQKIILCAHSHVPRIVRTSNKFIVNPGSVGLPAYDDDLPIYHKMENHNPCANYIIILFKGETPVVNRISIDYDFESAAKLAEENNRSDWSKWIRTGSI